MDSTGKTSMTKHAKAPRKKKGEPAKVVEMAYRSGGGFDKTGQAESKNYAQSGGYDTCFGWGLKL
jgi:hypothetical protein